MFADVERNTVTGGKCRPGECDDQCYPDSIMTAAGDCLCDMSKCDNGASVICGDDVVKHLVRKGTGVPGECCDVYQCVDKPGKFLIFFPIRISVFNLIQNISVLISIL